MNKLFWLAGAVIGYKVAEYGFGLLGKEVAKPVTKGEKK